MLASTKSNPLTTFITRSDTSLLSMQDYAKPTEPAITFTFVMLRKKSDLLNGEAIRATNADMILFGMRFRNLDKQGWDG